jgi:hypothetical protein
VEAVVVKKIGPALIMWPLVSFFKLAICNKNLAVKKDFRWRPVFLAAAHQCGDSQENGSRALNQLFKIDRILNRLRDWQKLVSA